MEDLKRKVKKLQQELDELNASIEKVRKEREQEQEANQNNCVFGDFGNRCYAIFDKYTGSYSLAVCMSSLYDIGEHIRADFRAVKKIDNGKITQIGQKFSVPFCEAIRVEVF